MGNGTTKVKLPPVGEVGLIVRDIDEAISHYASCGLGPFRITELDMKGFTYKGKKGDCRMKLAFLDGPPISIELVQVLEGDATPFSEFLDKNGEGVQHLGFFTNNLKGLLAEFSKEGIEPALSGRVPNVADFVFLYADPAKADGLMFELIQIY